MVNLLKSEIICRIIFYLCILGLLFPTLPRRPDLDEAMKMMDEIM